MARHRPPVPSPPRPAAPSSSGTGSSSTFPPEPLRRSPGCSVTEVAAPARPCRWKRYPKLRRPSGVTHCRRSGRPSEASRGRDYGAGTDGLGRRPDHRHIRTGRSVAGSTQPSSRPSRPLFVITAQASVASSAVTTNPLRFSAQAIRNAWSLAIPASVAPGCSSRAASSELNP